MSQYYDEQPVAGPSSRPWIADPNWRTWHYRAPENRHAGEHMETKDQRLNGRRRRGNRNGLISRQDAVTSPSSPDIPSASSSGEQPAAGPSDTATYPSASFDTASSSTLIPSAAESSFSSSSPAPLFSGARNETIYHPSSSSYPTASPSDSSPIYTSSSLPWSTRSRQSSAAPIPTFVPGVTLDMTLGGDSDTEAVYAVPIELGHGTQSSRKKRAPGDDDFSQVLNVQIDLGSSDMVRISPLFHLNPRLIEPIVAGVRRLHIFSMCRVQDVV